MPIKLCESPSSIPNLSPRRADFRVEQLENTMGIEGPINSDRGDLVERIRNDFFAGAEVNSSDRAVLL